MEIKGLISPNITIFDKDGKVDEKLMLWHTNWMLDNGVNGLFVTGTYGSGYLMEKEARVRVYELAKDLKEKRGIFVIGHVGGCDFETSKYLTDAARDIGLDAVSSINPTDKEYSDDELLFFYDALVKEAKDMPVFAYNNPGLTGKIVNLNLLERFSDAGIKGIKDSTSDVEYAKGILEDKKLQNNGFKYITGSTKNWDKLYKLGIDTMISGTCNYAPEYVAKLCKLSFGDTMVDSLTEDEKASREDNIIKALIYIDNINSAVKKGNSTVSSHIAIKARGFDAGYTKLPLEVNYDEEIDRMKNIEKTFELLKIEMV